MPLLRVPNKKADGRKTFLKMHQCLGRVKTGFHLLAQRSLVYCLFISLTVPVSLAADPVSPADSLPPEIAQCAVTNAPQKPPLFNKNFIRDVREILRFLRSVTEDHDHEARGWEALKHKLNVYRHFFTTIRMYNYDLSGAQADWKVYFQNHIFFSALSHGVESTLSLVVAPILFLTGHPIAGGAVASLILPGPDVLCRAVEVTSALSILFPRLAYRMKGARDWMWSGIRAIPDELGYVAVDDDQTASLLLAATQGKTRLVEFTKEENGNFHFTVRTPDGDPWVEIVYRFSERIRNYSLYSLSFFTEVLEKFASHSKKHAYQRLKEELKWLPWNTRDEARYSLEYVLDDAIYRKNPLDWILKFRSPSELEGAIGRLPAEKKKYASYRQENNTIFLEIGIPNGPRLFEWTFIPTRNAEFWIVDSVKGPSLEFQGPEDASRFLTPDIKEALEVPTLLFEMNDSGKEDFKETLELFLRGKLQRYLPPYLEFPRPLTFQNDRITLYYKDGLIKLPRTKIYDSSRRFTRIKKLWKSCVSYLEAAPWDKMPPVP